MRGILGLVLRKFDIMRNFIFCLVTVFTTALAQAMISRSAVEFQGSASERIEKAVSAAQSQGLRHVKIPEKDPLSEDGVWRIDRAIVVPSGISLILESCTIELKDGVEDDIIRNASFDKAGSVDKAFEVLGVKSKKSVLRGGLRAINVRNAEDFIISNLEIHNPRLNPIAVDKTKNGKLSNMLIGTCDSNALSPCILVHKENDSAQIEFISAYAKGDVLKDESSGAKTRGILNFNDRIDGEDVVMPPLVPTPRKVVRTSGAFLAPSAYVTRDWIVFERDASMKAESYRLSVKPTGVKVVAPDRRGELNAIATLRQLGEEKSRYRNCDFYTGGDIGRPLVLPCCEIEDYPEYPWRAMLIDEGRHFFGKETVKHVLKQMAAHKFNVLHWHLTEDQGWRIEIDAYPELVKRGSVRPCSPVHFACGDEMNTDTYGPFYYTKNDIREILAFAETLGIEVVPEIEFPGHIRAALAAYPEYSCTGEKLTRVPRCTWGVENDVLCVGNEEALKFVEKILDEVVELFPGKIIHIGGDECPTVRWKSCPKCRAKAKSLGIKVEKLQGYVTQRFGAYLAQKGKVIIGWDEILDCDIPKSAMVMSWRGRKGGLKAAKEGRYFVMCPSSHTYFNRTDGNPEDPFAPRNNHQDISLKKVYDFDPAHGLDEESRKYLLGSQACFWSEAIWNRYDLDWRMWPRSCAIAEVLWSGKNKKDFSEFVSGLKKHRLRLISQGVNVAPIYVKKASLP